MPTALKPADVRLSKTAQEEILMGVYNGKPSVVVEYRGTRVDSMKLTNKTTQLQEQRFILRHMVELGEGNQATIVEWLPSGSNGTFQAPAAKGDLILVEVTGWQLMKGQLECKGTFKALAKTA